MSHEIEKLAQAIKRVGTALQEIDGAVARHHYHSLELLIGELADADASLRKAIKETEAALPDLPAAVALCWIGENMTHDGVSPAARSKWLSGVDHLVDLFNGV